MPVPGEESLEMLELVDEVGSLIFLPPPIKHCDTRDSISSTDSDISLSFDNGTRSNSIDEGAVLADQSDCGSDSGSTAEKDSGCETVVDAEPPFNPPDDELASRIVSQVEFYFSDINITKDAFLLKHVRRNKEGYVSLKLISSFKRVKHLAKDWRVVAYALKKSTQLEINDLGTKLRRKHPLPPYDETTPSRTVVAMHLPSDKPTIENVAELFSVYGDIALIRILRPGNPVPADARSFFAKHPELTGSVCALVEYVNSESARKSVKMQQNNWKGYQQGIRVIELNAPPSVERSKRKNGVNNKKLSLQKISCYDYSSSCQSSSEAEPEGLRKFSKGDHRQQLLRRCSSPALSVRSPEYYPWAPWKGSAYKSSTSSLERRDSSTSTTSESCYSPTVRSRSNSAAFIESPVRSRHNSFDSSPRSRNNSLASIQITRTRSNSGILIPDNVIRLPKGPDGTRGFALGRMQCVMITS